MHLGYSTSKYKGKTYKSYSIVESYRDGEKVKKRTIWPIGKLTDAQAEQIKHICKEVKSKDQGNTKFEVKKKKKGIAMCEATAFLLKDNEQVKVMEAVDTVEPEEGGVKLISIFGDQKFINGQIHSVSLVDNKIFLKEH